MTESHHGIMRSSLFCSAENGGTVREAMIISTNCTALIFDHFWCTVHGAFPYGSILICGFVGSTKNRCDRFRSLIVYI
jgi:hypothetical protein